MTRWLRHPLFAPALALLALGWGVALNLFLLVGPNLGQWAQTLLTSCFGWNATRRGYRLDTVLLVTLEPPLFAFVVSVFYADELRQFLRGLRGRIVGGAVALGFTAVSLVLVLTGDVVGGAPTVGGAPPTRDGRPAPWTTLVDHRGHPFTLGPALGRPLALTFVYGECHDTCPVLIATLRSAATRLGDRARFAAITLDPEQDTVAALAAHAVRWQLDHTWRLLTGERAAVEAALAAYRVQAVRLASGALAHENVIVLIDAGGRLAFTYRGTVPTADELADALERLAAEPV
jgi:protein SCO1/2